MDAALPHPDVVRDEVAVGGLSLTIVRPRSAEDLIDEADYARDERLPYWADLWPSAVILAQAIGAEDLAGRRVIELGCGLGLPAIVAARAGAQVLATDWYEDALRFTRANASAAGASLETCLLDWNEPPPDLGGIDLAIGADLLYEQRNGPALAALLPHLLAPGAQALIADPRRPHADGLIAPLVAAGWGHEMQEARHEGRPDESGPIIHLHRLTAPGG